MKNLELNKPTKMCLIVKAIIDCCGLSRKDIAKECGYTQSAVSMWLRSPHKNRNDVERSGHYLKATRNVYIHNLNMLQSADSALACSIFSKYVYYIRNLYLWDESANSLFLELGLKSILYGRLQNTTLSDVPINRLCYYILETDEEHEERGSYIYLGYPYNQILKGVVHNVR